MNRRTVLSFDPLKNNFYAKVVRSEIAMSIDEAVGEVQLDLDHLAPFTDEDAVGKRGRMMRDALLAHQGISKVLANLSTVPLDEVRPLFIMPGMARAEQINWEMLCDSADSFFALDPRWPIARIIDPRNAKPQPACEFATPVRLLAVISAWGVSDQYMEWNHLYKAVLDARQAGLAVELKVFAAQPALFRQIQKDSLAAGCIEVQGIPQTASQLTQAIQLWAPNILHFFCHGYAGADGQWLELATATDFSTQAAGSVCISTLALERLASSLKTTWLTVLNCCSGGKASDGLQSMANLVVTAGMPAVVAMMEPVTSHNAYDFTESFYPGALHALIAVQEILRKDSSTTLEWTHMMFQVRQVIAEKSARKFKSREWSLPVLYVRGIDPPMFIRPVETDQKTLNGYHVRLKTAALWMRDAGPHLTVEERKAALEKGLEGVPTELWPNLDGEFPYASQ